MGTARREATEWRQAVERAAPAGAAQPATLIGIV